MRQLAHTPTLNIYIIARIAHARQMRAVRLIIVHKYDKNYDKILVAN